MSADQPAPRNPKALAAASARLAAVQVLYQDSYGQEPLEEILRRHAGEHAAQCAEDEGMLAEPDLGLLGRIVRGSKERGPELEMLLQANMAGRAPDSPKKTERLLHAIMLAGAYELLAHHDIDAPVIINDYLNVTHAFYEKGEVSLVNGVLDAIARILREDAA